MNYMLRLLILLWIILTGCNSAPSETLQTATPEKIATLDNGLPDFDSVEEAISFVVQEESFAVFRGGVWGSEYFEFALPSGAVTNNWRVSCYFNAVFRKFGTEAFDELAPLLDHEHEFVQIGAYSILNSYMYAHGLKRHVRQSRAERLAVMKELQKILASEGV